MIISRNSLIVVAIFFLSLSGLLSQIRLDKWVAHTSLVNTMSVDIDSSGKIWVASSGGLYSINSDGSDLRVFRNINEMLDINISTVRVHPVSGDIYAGSVNGYLDIYDNNGNWLHVTDIFNQRFTNPQIEDIAFSGDKAYIAGGFGLAVFDIKKMVFEETVRRFSNFNANNPVNRVLIKGDKIWIATTGGIAVANISSTLANPASWTGYKSNPGLFENEILDIAIDNDVTYAMSEKFITKLENDTLKENKSTQDKYTSIYADKELGLVYSTIFGMINSQSQLIEIPHVGFVNGFLPYNHNGNTGFVVVYEGNGIGLFINNVFTHYLPNSPLLNVSNDLSVDNEGNLWLATDIDPNGRGISKFDGNKWTNFTVKDYPEIKTNNYHTITAASDGRVVAGSYGAGLLVIEPDGNDYKFKLFDTTNSVLYGLAVEPSYLVCGKPRVDNVGNIWVPMLGNQSPGPSLVAFDKDYNSYVFTNPRNPILRFFSSLAIDYYGTKWVGGSSVQGQGMMYLNENGTFDDNNDDRSGMITQNDYPNMPDNTHSFVEVDKAGFVWIGTPRGLAVVANPSSAISNNQLSINIRNLNRLIGEQNINYILVDAQNNKWLATNNGVWIINSDGSDTLGTINKNNSPIPTNEIVSIAYNEKTGQIFFGSKMGIYEAQTLSVQPVADYKIICYPQPFDPLLDKEMVIDGLEEYSDIRIVTMSGSIVQKIFSNSRKAVWNGKDDNGNSVPNGVYLVLATSTTTKHSAIQKIAVVTK